MTATGNTISPAPANKYTQLRDYDPAQRLDILRGPDGPGFMPVTMDELNTAFRRWWHSDKGGEPMDVTLEKIFYSQQMLPKGKPEQAIKWIVTEFAAYSRQASRDLGVLMEAGKDLFVNPIEDDATATATDYFRGVPAHHGPGQLVRFIDLSRIADGQRTLDSFDFEPLGEIKKSKLTEKRGVIDPYTSGNPTKAVQTRMDEVLNGILASDLQPVVENAASDQEARLKFWGEALVEASRESLAWPIARTALRAPGMTKYFPEFNQPEV